MPANDITINIGARNLASATMSKVGQDTKRLGRNIRQFSMGAREGLNKLAGAFGGLRIAAVAGAAGFGLAVRTFANFDKSMAAVAAITKSTGADLDSLRDKAKELGATTQFSASEAADAMKFLGMAGYDTNEILAGVGPTLSLAAAGALELGQAADIASDVSSAFGLSADEIGRVADVLATTATSANTTVEMMGETFAKAAPIAKAAGQSIEEVSVAAGILGNSGIKASVAGTDLKNVMVALSKEDTATKIRALGVQITDTTGEMRPMLNVMEDFGTATEDMTGPQRLATAIDIFGKISGKSALILSDAGDEVDTLRDKMSQAEGSAKSMAETMQNNLGGVGTKIKSAFEGLGISMIEGMSEPLMEIGGMIAGNLSTMTKWFDNNKESVKEFGIGLKNAFTQGMQLSRMMADALWLLKRPLEWILEQLGKIDLQLAKAGMANYGIELTKWWYGQDFARTMGGGPSQEGMIIGQVVDGLRSRAGAKPTSVGNASRISTMGIGAQDFSGGDRSAIYQGVRDWLDGIRNSGTAERTYDVSARMRADGIMDAKQSRLLSGRGERRRNPVVTQVEKLERTFTNAMDGLAKAQIDAADRIIAAQPEFEVASVEVITA